MKKFWGFLLVIVLMTSCGEYQSLLKSNDYNLVYKKAIEYYNKGDYQRAMNLSVLYLSGRQKLRILLITGLFVVII